MQRAIFPTLCVLGCLSSTLYAAEPSPAQLDFFEKKIRPVLVEKCHQCHSTQAKKDRGGLLLDTKTSLLKGGETGPALVPGKPAESLLIKAIRHQGDLMMPPKGKLPETVINDFVKWIEMGAPDPRDGKAVATAINWSEARQFWSFQPVRKPTLPTIKDPKWIKTEIDRFIQARLEAQGLTLSAPADKRALIRRATFDLLGLPPTPEEIEAFVRDDSPEAFARVIDRLLASPHYGERWARYWLDVARYAEDQAHTFAVVPNTSAWRYRDWVIDAFNADMPYDRFVKLQIAADQMETSGPDDIKNRAALGFFGLGAQYYKNSDAARAAADELDDRIDTLARGFLGLTVSCARCHDHKFDPIPTQDYYSLAGVFQSCKLANLPLGSKEEQARYEEAQKKVQAVDKQMKDLLKTEKARLSKEKGKQIPDNEVQKLLPAETRAKMKTLKAEMDRLKKAVPPAPPIAHGLADTTARDMKVFVRGNPAQQGEVAPRRFLRILAGDNPSPFKKGSGRLELAEAIASKDNPLTARVLVNRLWQHHFGRGLVGTPSNFGQLGERPTHPELLDYLTVRFLDSGWSMKQMHRLIMLSGVYQQSSARNPRGQQVDPDNQLLWRMNRQRLDVEAWRDALLAVSGQLDETRGGPTTDLNSAQNVRRTVYGKISRHELSGLLRLFDFPDANITSEKRTETTVPQQQLFVLNSPFFVNQAKALASRLHKEAKDEAGRIHRAYQLVYGRAPQPTEIQLGMQYLQGKDDPQEKNQLTRWERYAQALLAANEFLYLD